MADEVVFGNHVSNILVHIEDELVYLWFNQVYEKSVVYFMTREQYVAMVMKMVEVANKEKK